MTPLPFPDLTSQDFGFLWVIGLKEVGRLNPKDLWLCSCKCGNQKRVVVAGAYLRTHEFWSCGCSGSNYPRTTFNPMFGNRFLNAVPIDKQPKILADIENQLRPTLYRGTWFVDYRRIRVVAIKD